MENPITQIPSKEQVDAYLANIEALNSLQPKRHIQLAIADKLVPANLPDAEKRLVVAMSLIGKTSNALSAVLDIHAQVYARLAAAQTMADVRSAIEPAIPLMTRVAAMRESGELLSVQHAQGMDNVDAVIEVLVAMTTCAQVFAQYQNQ